MAVDPVVPRSRRNVLMASLGGLAALLVSRLAQPEETDATTGTMVYGTVMDEGVDATSLTSAGGLTAIFHNTGSGTALQAIAAGASQPAITGANTSSGIGVMGGSASGIGVEGASTGGNGVYGQSTSGQGVLGISTSGSGVIGQSTTSAGVIGVTAATSEPGLYGLSTANNTGVIGLSQGPGFVLPPSSPAKTGVYGLATQDAAAVGVKGESTAGTGTSGVSATGVGVQGSSTSGAGVQGSSTSGAGVAGSSASGAGMAGSSTSGAGVVGSSSSSYGLLATSASASGVAAASGAPDQPGILGVSNGNHTGVLGLSRNGSGVVPVPASPANTGVYGYANQDATAVGVEGESTAGNGVVGKASTGNGIVGEATTGTGVAGQSSSNGVHGDSTGAGYGVYGTSALGTAVAGATSSPSAPAILGQSNGDSTGVFGVSGGILPAIPSETGVLGYAGQSATAVGLRGESTIGTAIVGQSVSNVGVLGFVGSSTPPTPPVGTAVFGASAIAGHDLYAGGSGRIGLTPNITSGPPTSGSYVAGDVFCDAAGNLWACIAAGSPGSFRKLAGPATAGSLHPITPARVYDSRLSDGPLLAGAMRTVSVATAVAGGAVVPSGAIAVAYNLTITTTLGRGWLGLVPSGAPFGTTSSINWFATGQTLANGGIVKLGGDRQADLWSGGSGGASTQLIIDITGYYL